MPHGGRIINIASRAFLGAPRQALYASAKAAVVTLTRCMALDLSDRGISVNAISPGLIETPMTDALPPERRAAIWQRMISRRPPGATKKKSQASSRCLRDPAAATSMARIFLSMPGGHSAEAWHCKIFASDNSSTAG